MIMIKLIGMFCLITPLSQMDSALRSAVVRSLSHPSLISITTCTSLITTTTAATSAIAGTNTTNATSKTSVRSLDAPGRRYGSLCRRLCHTQTVCRSGADATRAKPKHGSTGPAWWLEGSLELFCAYWCFLITIYKAWSRLIVTTAI